MTSILRGFLAFGLATVGGATSALAQDYSAYRVLTSNVIELMAGPANTAVMLSPDGTRALHIEGGEMCVWAPAPIGPWARRNCVETTSDTSPLGADDMRWSSDGAKLLMPTYRGAFQNFRESDIRLLDPETLAVTTLTEDGVLGNILKAEGANFDVIARWLDPDTVVFLRYPIGKEGVGKSGSAGLMRIDSDGSNETRLIDLPGDGRLVVYAMEPSADGKRIAYAVDDTTGETEPGVWILEVDSGVSAKVADTPEGTSAPIGLAFSADGSMLLLIAPSEEGRGIDAKVLDLATGEIAPVDAGQFIQNVAWSPTGAALAYVTFDGSSPDNPGGLYLADEPGKPGRLLLGGALMGPSCCGMQPFTWATNDTMVLAGIGNDSGTVRYVWLGD